MKNKLFHFLEFIKYIRISSKDKNVEDKNIELTPAQSAFLNWIERCKENGLRPFEFKGRNGRL